MSAYERSHSTQETKNIKYRHRLSHLKYDLSETDIRLRYAVVREIAYLGEAYEDMPVREIHLATGRV